MNRRILSALLAALLLTLTGCQFARDELQENSTQDRLIGVLITKEALDLYDMDRYLDDHLVDLLDGGEIAPGVEYAQKLYATLAARTLTNDETGETTEICEYTFEDTDGMALMAPTVVDPETGEGYLSSHGDDGISDAHFAFHTTDDGESLEITGTVYLAPLDESIVTLYLNSIFQTSDGRVYALPGSGVSLSTDSAAGSLFTRAEESTSTETSGSKTQTVSSRVEISIAAMAVPERIVVNQMSAQHVLLSQVEFLPGELPEMLTSLPDAEYFVVETHQRQSSGESGVSRALYDRASDSVTVFERRDDGVCIQQTINIEWPS